MSDEEKPKGPSLGPSMPNMPKMPSAEDSSPKGPSLGPSKGPTMGPNRIGPSLKANETKATTKKQEKKTRKTKKATVNVHELVRKWGVSRRRVRDSIQNLMLREIKDKIGMTSVNEVFRRHLVELMKGQLTYFAEMIDLIKKEEDELSLELADAKKEINTSSVVFENLSEIISTELEHMEEEKPIITEYIDEDLKRFNDARVEPRAAFWVIWYTAMTIREVREKSRESLDIVLEVLLKYKPAQRRALGVFLNFADAFIQNYHPFDIEFSRMSLVYNPTETGYNMAPWIKPRFGTYSQAYIEYQRYLTYYARSFGIVAGNSPDFEGGPLHGYRSWIQRTLEDLEERMRNSPILVENARGDTLEGMLIGLVDELKESKKKLERDPEGKIINHPGGIDGAIALIEWLFHTALNRYTTTNIAIHNEARLSLDMFDFVPDTVRWVNEYGEQIVMDWLGEEKEKSQDDSGEDTPQPTT